MESDRSGTPACCVAWLVSIFSISMLNCLLFIRRRNHFVATACKVSSFIAKTLYFLNGIPSIAVLTNACARSNAICQLKPIYILVAFIQLLLDLIIIKIDNETDIYDANTRKWQSGMISIALHCRCHRTIAVIKTLTHT